MRANILNGQLPFPSLAKVEDLFGKEIATFANSMWGAIWHNYLVSKGSISSAYWHDKLNNSEVFNILVVSLSNAGWIVSHAIPERNWLEIHLNESKLYEFVSAKEIEEVRANFKFAKYRLRNTEAQAPDLVRANGKTKVTGLYREGFQKAANTEFSFDIEALQANKEVIGKNLTKSMTKVREFYPEMGASIADYDAISVDILDWLTHTKETFTRGNTFLDSRGRAISSSLSKVANPISSKDFRALLIIPKKYRVKATQAGADAIFLFVAELAGYKAGPSVDDKTAYGIECWLSNFNHTLDVTNESDRADVYENIWLTRLYEDLNKFFQLKGVEGELIKQFALFTGVFDMDSTPDYEWTVPVEIDQGALPNIGAL